MQARPLQGEVPSRHKNQEEGHSSTIILEGGLCVYLLVGILMLLFISLHGKLSPNHENYI